MSQDHAAPAPLPFENAARAPGILRPRDIPLPPNWNHHIKRGLLAVVALSHRATVELYRRGHESVHPLFRHLIKLHRSETHTNLLDQQLEILKGRASRGRLGFYTDEERFSILLLQMARGWSHARTAAEFLHCPRTIALWHREFESGRVAGPRSPVNKFPDCVRLAVLTLKRTFPHLGHRKIAEYLARLGVLLAASTAHRILKSKKKPHRPPFKKLLRLKPDSTQLVARYPGHIWHTDITSIPVALGGYFSWWPTQFPRILPKHRQVVAVIDSFSREVVAIRAFGAGVTAKDVVATLDDAVRYAGAAPKHLICDKGPQFFNNKARERGRVLGQWLDANSVKVRFGAVGKKGSIAIIERFFLTLKNEGTRRMLIPLSRSEVQTELSVFAKWNNTKRPHSSLDGRTPEEARLGTPPPTERPRFETRPNYPVAAEDLAAGRVWRVSALKLNGRCYKRRRHLPDVFLDIEAA